MTADPSRRSSIVPGDAYEMVIGCPGLRAVRRLVRLAGARRAAARRQAAGAEGGRCRARLHAAGQRREDLLLVEAARARRRTGVVSESVHRWLNGRMQGPP